MATFTTVTFVMEVRYDNTSITYRNVNGQKSITLNLDKVDSITLTDAEQTLYYATMNGLQGVPYRMELSREDLITLKGIKDRSEGVVQEITLPAPTQQTFVSAPVDAGNGKQMMTKFVESKTNNATQDGIAGHRSSRVDGNIESLREEVRIEQLSKTIESCKGELSMLIYDIPSSKNQECPNPSSLLWWYGFRLNKSCWVLPEKGLNSSKVQNLLSHWKQHGIEVHIIPYAEHALAQIRAIARTKLEEEIRRVHTSLITRIASASDRLQEAMTELEAQEDTTQKERDLVASKRDNEVRAILEKSAEGLKASIACAEAFDETETVSDLIKGLRQAIRSEQATFNALMRQKQSKMSRVIV